MADPKVVSKEEAKAINERIERNRNAIKSMNAATIDALQDIYDFQLQNPDG